MLNLCGLAAYFVLCRFIEFRPLFTLLICSGEKHLYRILPFREHWMCPCLVPGGAMISYKVINPFIVIM